MIKKSSVMDITIKNAYEKLVTVFDGIEKASHAAGSKYSLKEVLAGDIYHFIRYISKSGAEFRYSYFNQVYQDGRYNADSLPSGNDGSIPESFRILCDFDMKSVISGNIEAAGFFVSFISELGKYYILSRFDKKDIDSEKYIDYLNQLQKYMSEQEKTASPQASAGKSHMEKKAETPKPVVKKASENETAYVPEINAEEDQEKTLEELLEELNSLIGLSGVKKEVNSLINLQKIKMIRESRGMGNPDISNHLVFLGNPGTGKTTVARLLSKIYKQIGVLETGQMIEVDRAGLVAGYVGQTALKTKEKIDEAMGGVLFIDEAYTLAKGGTDFGQEAIDTILKAMEDNRDNLVVVAAGYPDQMKAFLDSNPGLNSRFNKKIMFEDYTKEELFSIFMLYCKPLHLFLNPEAEICLQDYLDWLVKNKPEDFANGRDIRNIFEYVWQNRPNRLVEMPELSDEQLNEIRKEDFPDWVISPSHQKF